MEDGGTREEFADDEAFVGQLRNRPFQSFRVGRDLFKGYFAAIRPADGDTRPIWIARALSNPNCNPEKSNCVLIQYFRPTSTNQNVQEYYMGWGTSRGLRWMVDETQSPVWEQTNSLMTISKLGSKRAL